MTCFIIHMNIKSDGKMYYTGSLYDCIGNFQVWPGSDMPKEGIGMKIAVTGATGHLGRLVIKGLLRTQKAENIIAVVRDAVKADDLAKKGLQVRVAPYENIDALNPPLRQWIRRC